MQVAGANVVHQLAIFVARSLMASLFVIRMII